MTGTLESFTRQEAEEAIQRAGGKPTSSVSKNTDYVIAGESPGSKLDTAERLGTNVLDEEAFVKLLANPPLEAGG